MWSCIPVCHQERGPHPDSSAPSQSGTPLFLCTEYAVVASCVFHVSIPPLPTIPNNRYIQICSFSIEIINIVKYIHIFVMVRPVPSPVPDSRAPDQRFRRPGFKSWSFYFLCMETNFDSHIYYLHSQSLKSHEGIVRDQQKYSMWTPPPFPKDLISYE